MLTEDEKLIANHLRKHLDIDSFYSDEDMIIECDHTLSMHMAALSVAIDKFIKLIKDSFRSCLG
jgi:hypothetical protein